MPRIIIPITDSRHLASVSAAPRLMHAATGLLVDRHARPLQDLRISVTDRCNFRCTYCMPAEVFGPDYAYLPRSSLLSFEEIVRLARVFVAHGVTKIRLTGGEPLLRKNIEYLIEMLSALRTPNGQELDLTLTSNGSLLAKKAQSLKIAGLKRITVSLDALDDAIFKRMNDVNFPVAEVLRGIDAAHAAGLGPIKINMVVKGGINDAQIVPMARHFKGSPYILRFIEYMDVGASNGWQNTDVIPSAEVVRRINAVLPLQEIAPNYTGETAARWRYADDSSEIGMISSVTQAFCHVCTRARLSTDGKLYTCLFAGNGQDLGALLRSGCTDAEISAAVAAVWQNRNDRYSALRSDVALKHNPKIKKAEMSYIGG